LTHLSKVFRIRIDVLDKFRRPFLFTDMSTLAHGKPVNSERVALFYA
jgi:hypothetical protein